MDPYIYKKGPAFGMPGVLVDGMDVMKVLPRSILPRCCPLSTPHALRSFGRPLHALIVQVLQCPWPDRQLITGLRHCSQPGLAGPLHAWAPRLGCRHCWRPKLCST